ncbi:DUF4232 domain-containing protein, partial [Streptomyces sp. NPDC001787]
MRVYKLTFAALAVAASLSLTACQSGDSGTGQSAPSSASNGSSAGGSDQDGAKDTAGRSSSGKGAAVGTGSNVSSKVGKCRTDELEVTASDQSISDESEGTVVVEFKNGG